MMEFRKVDSIKRIQKKLGEKKGESLVETLVSVLIVVLMMTMLVGSVVTAARINKKAADIETTYSISGAKADGGIQFILSGSNGEEVLSTMGGADGVFKTVLYQTDEGYYYVSSGYQE